MKRLLLLSITLFLLLPLAGATVIAGPGEPVSVSLKGTIKAQELKIDVRGEGMVRGEGKMRGGGKDDELIDEDILMFDFPITDHDKRSWVKEVPLYLTYSSNQNLSSSAHLIFTISEFVGDNGGILKPKLRADNLNTNTFLIDPNPDRIQLRTTFEVGQQTDTPIGTLIVVFAKTEDDLFPAGNYTGVFYINYLGVN